MKLWITQILTKILKPVAEIRDGERTKTLLMFIYFFLTIALIYILKPVQKSLFLAEFGAENLRYANIGEGIFLILVVSAYVQFAKRAPRTLFYYGILGFFLLNLVLFWFLFKGQIPYMSGVFYLWQAAFSITITTVFWTLANDLFNTDEAKRLFGLIISGGSAGGVLGGFLTSHFVATLHVEDLLLIAAGVVFLCIGIVYVLWTKIPHAVNDQDHLPTTQTPAEESAIEPPAPPVKNKEKQKSVWSLFSSSSYLVMLLLMVIITKMAATIVDNQFGGIVQASMSGKEAMAAFYGQFFAWLNMLSFVMQLVATGICLRWLGAGLSIWILPIGLGLLSFTGFLYPVLAVGIVLKMFDGSVNYSVQQASKEMLYLPVSSRVRRRIKPVIDMLGYRGAKAFAGIYIALLAPILSLPVERLGLLVLTLLPVWLFIVWKMGRDYRKVTLESISPGEPTSASEGTA